MAYAAITSGINQEKGISYSGITDNSSDWTGVPNSTYFYDKATDLAYYKDSSGVVLSIFVAAVDSIYTADGTLSGDRIVSLSSNNLTFNGTGMFKVSNGAKSVYPSWNTHSVFNIDNGNGTVWSLYNANASSTFNANEFGIGVGSSIPFRIFNNTSIALGGVGKSVLDTNYSVQTNGNTLIGGNIDAKSGTNLLSFDFANYSKIKIGTSTSQWWFVNSNAGNSSTFDDNDLYLWDSTNSRKVVRFNANGSTELLNKVELSTTTDGFLMPRLTTVQMNAISSPDTDLLVFNTDLDCVMRYNGTAWTTFDTPKYILKTAGACTPYSDLYTAINDAVNGSIIDVNISETVDCGGINTWTWSNNITINFNGHHTIFSNLGRILLAAGVSLGINNGTLESSASVSSNTAAIMFSGGNTVKGDGAITVFQNTGVSTRGSFASQTGTALNYISGVIMKGSYTFCVRNSAGNGRIYIDNCVLYTDLSTNVDALSGDNMEISNSTIHGRAFSVSGAYTIPSRETVRVFNNCTIISDGESAIGSRSAIFNGCTITTNDDEIRIGIGGEQEYYNSKLERTGTVGYAFVITNTSNVRMYNTQIISSGGGVSTNLPMEFYECYVKANGGAGILNTNGAGMIIRGGIIDSTVGSSILFNTANVVGIAKISNVTLICNTTGKYCLDVISNTTLTFSNLSMKNTATSTDIYSRAGILSENLQIETTDAFGNIILK